jgi:hypothetical protein
MRQHERHLQTLLNQQPWRQSAAVPYEAEILPQGRGRRGHFDLVLFSTALVALALGLGTWVIGARYTIDGVLIAVNWLLGLVSSIVIEPSEHLYLWLSFIPIFFSLIEWGTGARLRHAEWEGRVVWLAVAAADLITTGVGLAGIDANNSTLTAWFVASIPAIIVVTVLLTFFPEWIARWGWRKLWGTLRGI